jgi:hypothetical protein
MNAKGARIIYSLFVDHPVKAAPIASLLLRHAIRIPKAAYPEGFLLRSHRDANRFLRQAKVIDALSVGATEPMLFLLMMYWMPKKL